MRTSPIAGTLPPFLLPSTSKLIPYWATRWHCIKCGKYLAGSRTPPSSIQAPCPHCKRPALLETSCQGMTSRVLPFYDKAIVPLAGMRPNGATEQWWAQTARRVHRKGGKRRAGEKDKPHYTPMPYDDED